MGWWGGGGLGARQNLHILWCAPCVWGARKLLHSELLRGLLGRAVLLPLTPPPPSSTPPPPSSAMVTRPSARKSALARLVLSAPEPLQPLFYLGWVGWLAG